MSNLIKKVCNDCGKIFRYLRLRKGRFVCYLCAQHYETSMPRVTMFSREPTKSRTFSVCLPGSSLDLLDDRLEEIGATSTDYLRALIISDLDHANPDMSKEFQDEEKVIEK